MNEITKNYLNCLNISSVKNLEDITGLIKAHISNFTFSSLKVLLKKDISLELNDIYEDLVVKKRGGYCFEHNKLMYEVLKDLGFDVKFFLARVINNSDAEVPTTHRFTLLTYENEEYIVDVGIGFNTPNLPVRFSGFSRSHHGIIYKVQKNEDKTFFMQRIKDGEVYNITKFDLNPCVEADFELGHFYSHKHPCAVFVNNLVLSLILDNEMRSLRNDIYFKIYEDRKEQIDISSIEKFSKVIAKDFNMNFNEEEIKTIFEKYVKKAI